MLEWWVKIKWVRKKKPMVTYEGFHCGCCGRWVNMKFSIPTYKSISEWWDTWGICPRCEKAE
jgi:hypothetical protein